MQIFADGARAADAAASGAVAQSERLILMFDGTNEDAVADSRAQWKSLKERVIALLLAAGGARRPRKKA